MSASTIYALSSGTGRAGIAVIRVSGPAAADSLVQLVGMIPKPRHASVRVIRHPSSGDLIDRALVLWLPAPATVTGDDVAELHVHGGLAVVRDVLAALACVPGVRLAEPGEFTRRAFENGKLDLTQVEGLADLIEAETVTQRRQAFRQADGHLHRLYEGWRGDVLRASGLVEAAIDFSDEEDVAADAIGHAIVIASSLFKSLQTHLADNRRGELIRDGFRVVLLGPPNSGKSSLINSLVRRDVAIVSDEAGTTRDVLDVRLELGGFAVIVSDTAGLREAGGKIEREGIRRALARAEMADLALWLVDMTIDLEPPPRDLVMRGIPLLRVFNKFDLAPKPGQGLQIGDGVFISALTGAGMEDLVTAIASAARDRIGCEESIPLTQVRHRQALIDCRDALDQFLVGSDLGVEVRAEALRQAAVALGRLTGRIDVEDVLGEIFSRFCIGK